MKKLVCVLFAAMLFISAAAAEFDLSALTEEELRALRDEIDAELLYRACPLPGEILLDNGEIQVKLVLIEIVETDMGNTRVILNYEWTNLSKSDMNLSWDFGISGYADGVRISPHNEGFSTYIKPGITYNASSIFLVTTGTKQVEISFYKPYSSIVFRTFAIDLRWPDAAPEEATPEAP